MLVVDAGRPRNAATLRSHGFLTRDGISPLELRKLARAELSAYPTVRVLDRTNLTALGTAEPPADAADGIRFVATVKSHRSGAPTVIAARSAVIATGLRETLPAIPSLRGFYGMSLFSCAACDAWELQDRPLALIGETPDLPARARLIARWTDDLTVFTNGADVVETVEEAELAASGIVVERRRIDDLEGDRGAVSAVRLQDGTRIADRRRIRPPALGSGARVPRPPGRRPRPGRSPSRRSVGPHEHRGAVRRGGCRGPGSAAADRRRRPGCARRRRADPRSRGRPHRPLRIPHARPDRR